MRIFVYGTLQSGKLAHAVAGGDPIAQTPAHISDYAVWPVADHVVPLIRAQAGAVTQGAILDGVSDAQLTRLDTYEGAFGYQLIDVTVTTAAGDVAAKMYLPPADIAVGDGTWSFAQWQTNCEATAVLAATELFSHDPPMTKPHIAAQFHMIEKRAWAKACGAQTSAPATLRQKATPVEIVNAAPPQGTFFRIQQMHIQHQRFDGDTSEILPREIFAGVDAVLVLPYDAVRDRLLLVEQLRMGPLGRHDPCPWVLEPVAGMVDAFETPDETAHRESAEEAGLHDLDLHHLSSFYPSPGSSTDYFHAYLGLCDLPDDRPQFGGLATEAEDLRLHMISFDAAMDLVASGEINAGPLVMMLSMLALRRDALRKAV